ncbi:DUF2835 family protein [Thiorhodovibrio frisius]|jgi:hypothetical protein|uniref:DUF2835 family protein n=1 Tax=Thiorhodovibrio frisius TaxID=631362 RepID=UPI00167F360C|nr:MULTISPECIES: DUF2835 family protein [Thiorhodovibrio]
MPPANRGETRGTLRRHWVTAKALKTYEFSLRIPREDLLAFYEGRSRSISVVANNGLRLELPAEAFRRYIDHFGLRGYFRVLVTDEHRLIELQRLAV